MKPINNSPPIAPLTPQRGTTAMQAGQDVQNAGAGEMQTLFRDFVGQTLFGELMSAMHKTHDKAAYFHGGQAEEIFQQQLDEVMVEEITEASASQIADPMFELFQLSRTGG
ncbi:MAG: hypothetical protein R3C05_25705 [Pirellulaceae bacterium]